MTHTTYKIRCTLELADITVEGDYFTYTENGEVLIFKNIANVKTLIAFFPTVVSIIGTSK